MLLKHGEDGSVSTSVLRKPTHTNRYLDFMSHHPKAHKAAVVRTLFTRADALSFSDVSSSEERQRISPPLRMNKYTDTFVKRTSVHGHLASPSEHHHSLCERPF